jgi:hypothetical protein
MEEYQLTSKNRLYKVCVEGKNKIYWYGPGGKFGEELLRGKCTIHGDILVLNIVYGRKTGEFVEGRSFRHEVWKLPRWGKTKYFCEVSDLVLSSYEKPVDPWYAKMAARAVRMEVEG